MAGDQAANPATDDTWIFQANVADASLDDPNVDDDDGSGGPTTHHEPFRRRDGKPVFDYPRGYERGSIKAPSSPAFYEPQDIKRMPLTQLTKATRSRDADMVKDPSGKTR